MGEILTRHQQRIMAMQILYGLDIKDELTLLQARSQLQQYKQAKDLADQGYYFEELVIGVIEKLITYDQKLNNQAIDWQVSRMAYIDRNILRIALYEMESGLPTGVAINEAVELAKEYGDSKSSSFVNGILAQVGE